MTNPTNRPPAATPSWTRFLLPAAIPLMIGGFFGYLLGYGATEQSAYAIYGLGIVIFALGSLVAIALLIGVVNWFRGEGRGRRAAQLAFGVAGLLLLGAGVGFATVPSFDLGYHPGTPVPGPSLNATVEATVTLRLDDERGSAVDPIWEASADGVGTCPFEEDGSVRFVIADNVGRLQGQPMSVQVDLPHNPAAEREVLLTLVVGNETASWWGPVKVVEIDPGEFSGRATFLHLKSLGGDVPGWPHFLRGEVSWVCG